MVGLDAGIRDMLRMPLQELPKRRPAMTISRFLFRRELSKCLLNLRKIKQWIVSEPIRPAGSIEKIPSAAPRNVARVFPSRATANTHTNLAVRFSGGTPRSSRRRRALLASSSVFSVARCGWSAAYRAECTPGAPFSASTSRPESSARTILPRRAGCTPPLSCAHSLRR